MEELKKEKIVKSKKSTERKSLKKKSTGKSGENIQPTNEKNKNRKERIKKHFNKYKKLYKLIISIILIVAVGILAYVGIRNYILVKKYGKYEKKMDDYGFSLMYNNETAKSSEYVTRVEMVKIIIGSILNTTEVSSRGFVSTEKFENDEWVEMAKAYGIIDKKYITEENFDHVATYKDALVIYLKAREKIMDIAVSSKSESRFKNLNSYTEEERAYINDAVENDLIENSNNKLKINKNMVKGEFNKLVVKFVEKYNTIIPEGETLVTKQESKPENANIYPYILYSVDKEVYEYKQFGEGGPDYRTPVETYKYKKDYYDQVEYRSEIYYNQILNVDYRTIDKEKFLKTTDEFLRFDYTDIISKYVDYVKENDIIIEGKAKVQLPIFYLDGISYRARIKLIFEIKNSKTDKNLLLGDSQRANGVTYKNKKYEIYIDAPMGTTMFGQSLLLDMEPIIDLMINDTEASANGAL